MYKFLKDQYPQVASIHLKLAYRTDAGTTIFKEEERILGPENFVPNHIKCIQRECVRGGFDLSAELQEAIIRKQSEGNGKKVCRGWQDNERINLYHCLYELYFDYKIEYFDGEK